jgi:alpha-1,3-rhamnosyl/mannosyltransferase
MRVVLDARTATDHFPGIGRYVVNLAHGLKAVAPELDLALLYDPTAMATRLSLPDVPRIACPVSPFALRQQWAVPPVIGRSGAEVYHSAYFLMPYRPPVPAALTAYDLIPLIYPQYYGRWQPLIFRLAMALALRTAAITLAISQATKVDLIRYFHVDPARIAVTPLAADAAMRVATPEQMAAVRAKYALPDEYALYLGINKPHKNLVRLVDAWAGVRCRSAKAAEGAGSRAVPTVLVIAGHWDNRYPEPKQRAIELQAEDSICFAGPVAEPDLPALYSGAKLFIFPSLYEGFGLPVLEAMSCGTPVICSNGSSLPEVAGKAALLVDPTSVEEMTEAIDGLLYDPARRQEMREKGLAQARRFSWEDTARRTLDAYRGMLR